VQFTVLSVQVHPLPVRAIAVRPVGKVSVTVTEALVAPVPTLETVRVYVPPTSACVKFPLFVFVMVRSGAETPRVTDTLLPVPPLSEVTFPVRSVFEPGVVAFTFTENAHEELAAIVAPDKLILLEPATPVITSPVQEPVIPLGVSTIRPAGRTSTNPTSSKPAAAFGFEIENVSVLLPFNETLEGLNAAVNDAGAITIRVAVLLAAPPPLSVEEIIPLVFVCTPAETPVTFTLITQDAFAASIAPDRAIEADPAAAVIVPFAQELVSPLGDEICNPAGKLSENEIPLSEITFADGLVILKASVVDPFNGMVTAPNVAAMDGAVAERRVAEALFPVPPLVELTLPVVLRNVPAMAVVTLTLNVHEPCAAIVPPVMTTLFPPATAVIAAPPHDPLRPFGEATSKPAGNVSVKATPVSDTVLLVGFVIVNESELGLFGAMLAAPNAFARTGGATTVMLAEAVPPVPP
jgi:hypothetical protein